MKFLIVFLATGIMELAAIMLKKCTTKEEFESRIKLSKILIIIHGLLAVVFLICFLALSEPDKDAFSTMLFFDILFGVAWYLRIVFDKKKIKSSEKKTEDTDWISKENNSDEGKKENKQ